MAVVRSHKLMHQLLGKACVATVPLRCEARRVDWVDFPLLSRPSNTMNRPLLLSIVMPRIFLLSARRPAYARVRAPFIINSINPFKSLSFLKNGLSFLRGLLGVGSSKAGDALAAAGQAAT